MTQKITQMRLIRYLFTALLALLFVSWNKGRSSDEPKPNNGAQTTSSKQVEDEIGFGQREVTLQVGETAKVTLHGARSPRIETSNSNLVEATLIEQGTAVSLKGLQAGEGTIRVLSSNRYAELKVVVKANKEDSNNSLNGNNIVWDKTRPSDYKLSSDGLVLFEWKNPNTKKLDMNLDVFLRKIKVIGERAFIDCSSLTCVNIPNSVVIIGERAFARCSSLTSINIPSSVTSIGERAFSGCRSLTNVNIPSSVTNIGYYAFQNCQSLTNVNIPSSVTLVSGFEGCTSLTSVNIPSSVTTIGGWSFFGCISLTEITIPSSVTSIGSEAFLGCRSLTRVLFMGNNPPKFSAPYKDPYYNVFRATPKHIKFIVPKGARRAYIKAGYPADKIIER